MNQTELQAIRDRAAAALPAPWGWFGNTRTHQVHLATAHSGRMFLLMPTVETTYTARHVDDDEGCSIAAAAQSIEDQLEGWFPPEDLYCPECEASPLEGEDHRGFGARANEVDSPEEACPSPDWRPKEHPLRARAKKWIDDLQRNPEYGSFDFYDDGGRIVIQLHASDHAVLQFQRRDDSGAPDHLLQSYRDLARYEVLDGRTLAEHEAGGFEGDLYREDIVGLAHPDAEFIANSRGDVDALLSEIDRLRDALRIAALPTEVCDAAEYDDLFDRGLVRNYELANTGEYEGGPTREGTDFIKQVFQDHFAAAVVA